MCALLTKQLSSLSSAVKWRVEPKVERGRERAQFSTFLCMLRMHSTQPRMASLDSWDRTRSQMWRSAVPRCVAPVERILLRYCATEPTSLLLRSLITRDRSKMKTAGMLPDCAALKSWKKKKKAQKRRGKKEGWLREGMKSPPLLSRFLSVRSNRGGCKAWLSKLPLYPNRKSSKIRDPE